MHIILGLLGVIVSILVLLNRLAEAGIDLGGLNPFLWRRRRQWQAKLEGNPVYHIESPLDLTALLATATVKTDGDMSSNEKQALLDLFQSEFNMSKKDSADLLLASAFLLGKGEEVNKNLEKVIQPSLNEFSEDQFTSALQLLEKVSTIDATGNELKQQFVERVRIIFNQHTEPKGKWE